MRVVLYNSNKKRTLNYVAYWLKFTQIWGVVLSLGRLIRGNIRYLVRGDYQITFIPDHVLILPLISLFN